MSTKQNNPMRAGIILTLAIAVSLLGACNRQRNEHFSLGSNTAPNTGGGTAPPSNPGVMPVASYADTVSKVTPAVVTIHSQIRARQPQQFPFMDDPFFRRFFGERGQQQTPNQPRQEGLGSGVIVRQDGYILTNHHVIDGADQISVDLNDHRSLPAKVVGSDAPSDLAVLKVDASGLPVLPLGNSDQTRVGDVVLAIGNPDRKSTRL